MDLVNETALEVAWTVSRIKPSSFLMTVLAKGTYQMQPDSAAIPADEQLALTGDEFEAGDPAGPLRYSFDFAPFKPRADVLLVGSCHAPGGTPTPTMRVSLQIASITKSLDIVGDRYWRGQNETTQPRPFATMPLTWSSSFGGPGFDANPLGKGFAPVVGPDGRSLHPLPNIESLAQPVRSLTDRVEPVGFGPILDTWPQRLKKFGSFDAGYVKELWPGYPRDFDSGFFNAAPEDQQVEGYLAGDEQYAAENLHKIRPIYRGHLPGIRVRAFLNEHVYVGEQLRELPMRLDTLWIDMDAERLVLVWRGCSPVADASLEDIAHLLFVAEPLSQQGLSTEHYVGVLDEALMRREDEEDEDFEDEDVEDESLEAKDTVGTDTEAAEASIQAGAFAEAEPPTAESIEPEEEPVPDDERPLTEKRVREMLAERRSFAGCDLSGLELTRLDFSGCLLREAILQGANLGEVNFSRADLSGAVIAGANLHGATCNGANFAEADLTSAWLVSADLSGTNLQGADLTDAKLRNAVMIESNAAEAVFTGADLSGANLERADLTAADLCESRLHRTNLAGANLSEAALEGAWGRDVTAVSTNLTKIRAAGAHLTRANFREAAGEEAVLEAADLPAADFTGAVLPRAEFTGAQLRDAVFDSATLNGSRFNEADLQRARMVRCNLYESSLDNADLTNADIRESNLFGTTLMDAVLQNTDLQGANLRRVKTREDIP